MLRRMAVFDVLVNNADRKGNHVLAWPADNERCHLMGAPNRHLLSRHCGRERPPAGPGSPRKPTACSRAFRVPGRLWQPMRSLRPTAMLRSNPTAPKTMPRSPMVARAGKTAAPLASLPALGVVFGDIGTSPPYALSTSRAQGPARP